MRPWFDLFLKTDLHFVPIVVLLVLVFVQKKLKFLYDCISNEVELRQDWSNPGELLYGNSRTLYVYMGIHFIFCTMPNTNGLIGHNKDFDDFNSKHFHGRKLVWNSPSISVFSLLWHWKWNEGGEGKKHYIALCL